MAADSPGAGIRTLTVQQVASRFNVSTSTVAYWIVSGQLQAFNASRSASAVNRRWRVSPEALEAFELTRAAAPVPPVRPRRKRPRGDVIEFYT